jgi:hypothetical protein
LSTAGTGEGIDTGEGVIAGVDETKRTTGQIWGYGEDADVDVDLDVGSAAGRRRPVCGRLDRRGP